MKTDHRTEPVDHCRQTGDRAKLGPPTGKSEGRSVTIGSGLFGRPFHLTGGRHRGVSRLNTGIGFPA